MDLVTIEGKWDFNYTYFAGESASRFFHELRENQRIMGTRCTKCEKLLVPARSYCDVCMAPTDEWAEVGPEGTLETFTIIATAFPGLPPPPIVMAYVTLDGADTALGGYFQGVDLTDPAAAAEKLKIGTRVTTKFAEERKGEMLDFWFELA